MDEILRCDHSNETSSAVLSLGTIDFTGSSNFSALWAKFCGMQYFALVLSILLY